MMKILIQKKRNYLMCVTKLLILVVFLISSNVMLSGQVVEDSAKKSSDLKAKSLGENLLIIDNSTGHLTLELAVDGLRKAADSLGQAFGFQTIFQGMYLHIGAQPEELRTIIQDYNLANLDGVDAERPSIALFAKHGVKGESTIIEDRVDWTGYSDLDNISQAMQATVRGLAVAAAKNVLEQNGSSLEEAAQVYIETFLQTLKDPPRHYFLIKRKFYGPENTLYLPRSDFALPIKVIKEEDYELGDTTRPVLEYRWKKKGSLIDNFGGLLPKRASGSDTGQQIAATFDNNKEMAATSIVVVEVDIDQKPPAANYSIDDNEIEAYPTYSEFRIKNNIAPYKCIAQGGMEEIPINLKPRGIPLEVVSIRALTPQNIPINVNDDDLSFTLSGNGNNLLTIAVDESDYKNIKISNKPNIIIPITFIRVSNRFQNGFGKETVEGPGTFEQADATEVINILNQIYGRVNVSFQLGQIEDIEVPNDNNQFDYRLTGGIGELVLIWNHTNVKAALARGDYPVLIVKKLVNLDYVNSNSVAAGITPNSTFISIVALEYPDKNKMPVGQSAAHEIGHGYFGLIHPFEEFEDRLVGTDKYNLMDYNKATTQKYFRGYQFNSIIFHQIK